MKADVGSACRAPNALAGRIAVVRAEVDAACRAAGRDPAGVVVVGVTKRQPRAVVFEAIASGLEDIAENYVQEARAKLVGVAPVRKHFIGHVQTNKARAIVETFDVVQSVDRIEAGQALVRAERLVGKRVRALVQVNVSPTERFGVAPVEAGLLADRLRAEGLDVDGVMAIGPHTTDRAAISEAFTQAAHAFRAVGGSTLSLGMSDDWREAVACGSTMVRLGTALFGSRV
jgi:hypothetical protein